MSIPSVPRYRSLRLWFLVLVLVSCTGVRPQSRSGRDWRLVTDQDTGHPHAVSYATSPEQLATGWAALRLQGSLPRIDFTRDVVLFFGAVVSSGASGCETIRLIDVVVNTDTRVVLGRLKRPTVLGTCHRDARPHTFVVALRRSALSSGPFRVQISGEPLHANRPIDLVPEGELDPCTLLTVAEVAGAAGHAVGTAVRVPPIGFPDRPVLCVYHLQGGDIPNVMVMAIRPSDGVLYQRTKPRWGPYRPGADGGLKDQVLFSVSLPQGGGGQAASQIVAGLAEKAASRI